MQIPAAQIPVRTEVSAGPPEGPTYATVSQDTWAQTVSFLPLGTLVHPDPVRTGVSVSQHRPLPTDAIAPLDSLGSTASLGQAVQTLVLPALVRTEVGVWEPRPPPTGVNAPLDSLAPTASSGPRETLARRTLVETEESV